MSKAIKQIIEKIRLGKRPNMVIVYPSGKNQKALVDFFCHRHFGGVDYYFNVQYVKCPMNNADKLIKITNLPKIRCADIVVLIRGGGSDIEVFDDKNVVNAFEKLRSIGVVLCVGIGHAEDTPAIYKIADVGAITPTELSVFFKDMVSLKENFMEKWKTIINNSNKYLTLDEKLKNLDELTNPFRELNEAIKKKKEKGDKFREKIFEKVFMVVFFTALFLFPFSYTRSETIWLVLRFLSYLTIIFSIVYIFYSGIKLKKESEWRWLTYDEWMELQKENIENPTSINYYVYHDK